MNAWSSVDRRRHGRGLVYKKASMKKSRRLHVHGQFMAARAEYLRASGWVPVAPIVPGGPIWWRDPKPEGDQKEFRADHAADIQEMRDVDALRELP
jgi:hypothetical protein